MRANRIAAALSAAAFAFCGLCAPLGAADGPDQVVVGAVLPLTGEESRIGGYYKLAYELAVKEYNDHGGVELRAYHRKIPIKLIIYDDKTDPATSRNLYERLAVQDHVDAMLGGYSTDLVQAQTVVAFQHEVPYVGGGGAATAIYKRGFKTVFGLLSSIQNLAFSECDFIEAMQAQGKLPKPLKMAVVYENTSHGKDFVEGLTMRAKAKPKNFQIVLNEAFDLHGKDFGPLLQKVKATSANAFMSDAHLDDYITMQRQYRQAGLHHAYVTYGARGPEKAARDALGDGVHRGVLEPALGEHGQRGVQDLLLALGALGGEAAFSLLATPILPRLGPMFVATFGCAIAAVMYWMHSSEPLPSSTSQPLGTCITSRISARSSLAVGTG